LNPLISSILPTYNRADSFLKGCIGYHFAQTYENWELIIVDDGSTDNTKEVTLSYKDDRIKYVKLDENTGYPSVARNVGICHSTGTFIVHTDDDSAMSYRKFEVLLEALSKDPSAPVAYGDRYTYMNGSKSPILNRHPGYDPMTGPGLDTSQFMYRAAVYKTMPLVFARNACDWRLLQRIWTDISKNFIHVDIAVSAYFFHSSNRSNNNAQIANKVLEPEKFRKYFEPYFEKYMIDLSPV